MSDDSPRPYGASDLTYDSYLKVEDLLRLQVPQSDPPHHDEMLFIVIHQTYELWFKLILHELEQAIAYLKQAKVLRARHFVQRVVEILRVLVQQIHILETMAPVEFLAFRHRLMPASGFQSVQFREVEFVCGLRDERFYKFFKNTPEAVERLKRRMAETSLRDAFYDMLRTIGLPVPDDISLKTLEGDPEVRRRLFDALLPLYQDPERHLGLNLLAESLVSLDEQLGLWRVHHVRVVERIIGFKRGTGGSSGVGYLQSTTAKKCFPYLWELRTVLEVPGDR